MNVYADSNFIVSLYLPWRDNGLALRIHQEEGRSPLPVTSLTRCEVINSFQLSYFLGKSGAGPSFTSEQILLAEQDFLDDLRDGEILRRATAEEARLDALFVSLSHRHTGRHGFRTYDLMHVATALSFGCRSFWSFDTKASRLAKLEGLKTA